MIRKMLKEQVFFLHVISLLFLSCESENQRSSKTQFDHHCGSCHMAPDPTSIPKTIWKNSVLPEMAARMGYRYNDFDPYRYQTAKESLYINRSNKYPDERMIDSATWWGIHDYIVGLAPDSIPIDMTRKKRNSDLAQFSLRKIELPKRSDPVITSIQFDSVHHLFSIADANGDLHQWPNQKIDITERFKSAVTSYNPKENNFFVTEVGILNPSEIPLGLFSKIRMGISDTIAKELHRPVFLEIVDLNDDGEDEFLICEFGNLTGQLSLLEVGENGYDKRALSTLPGAVKLEIADMDGDGKKDIVALFAQGNEGVFIFYQKSNLQFSSEQVIRLPPEFGSSWFELIDYDSDGDLDIVMTNGDNADYSIFLKPYHGIRLFLNNGSNMFNQKWFYPLYGATRVLADDYDLDGDYDFAISALFNDRENTPRESFVYLENKASMNYEFKSYTFKDEFSSGWLTMAKGDYDGDGDIDIMVGSFNVKGLRKKKTFFKPQKEEVVTLILLDNRQNLSTGKGRFQ
ncbi:FG-GAP repeat domain-containing protein [Pareuzebyella sediminis]|uniref:FG-GAP repeat domain-containing protein n=1 Tax=Pareuzebyella sediminis TaxID=2607998 RepID=UPI0011ECCBD6|nr:VCBS repeat-containing protein [Pareuzebyella sediminis]